MHTYSLSQLSEKTLDTLVTLREPKSVSSEWEKMKVPLTEAECGKLEDRKAALRDIKLVALNESTLWARAIYPLLELAEQEHIKAWSGVPLKAAYPAFQLEGEADGAFAPCIAGRMHLPYFVIHETKRGTNAPDPLYQLYGEMLAAAWLNWKKDTTPEQEIFGCYTVSDSWTFVQGIVCDFEMERPTFTVELSKEYNGTLEAERIVQILKSIVAKYVNMNI